MTYLKEHKNEKCERSLTFVKVRKQLQYTISDLTRAVKYALEYFLHTDSNVVLLSFL